MPLSAAGTSLVGEATRTEVPEVSRVGEALEPTQLISHLVTRSLSHSVTCYLHFQIIPLLNTQKLFVANHHQFPTIEQSVPLV